MSPAATPASTRWCPTTEQLMILEEMYKSGVRTPNATQIQHITAHLAYYGKIEGKNVFYWFQNHKARDRQKLRRKLINRQQQHLLRHLHDEQQPFTTIGIGPGLHQFPHFLHPQHEVIIIIHSSLYGPPTAFQKYPCCNNVNNNNTYFNNTNDNNHNRPILKTLELFPVKSTNLKDECRSTNTTTSSMQQHQLHFLSSATCSSTTTS
ncbi:hypothetical protein MKX01_013300 [Papaver californicum]|nr:hypothetical protein MKX01_013300 [Papaver californicum]